MQGARSRRATLHVRNAFPACNLAPRERAKTEQTLNVWLVIYRTQEEESISATVHLGTEWACPQVLCPIL